MFVSCECFVLPDRSLCDGLIPCPQDSYGFLSVVSVMFWQVAVSAKG